MNDNKMKEIQSCIRCGNMFLYAENGKCLCEKCKEEDEEQFQIVKNYIYENPSATILDVSKVTGIRAVRIKSFLRDGRIVIANNSIVFLKCEVCGTNIKFGRICRQCMNTLSIELKNQMGIDEYQVGDRPN